MKNITDRIGDIMFGKTADKITKFITACCVIYIVIMILMAILS